MYHYHVLLTCQTQGLYRFDLKIQHVSIQGSVNLMSIYCDRVTLEMHLVCWEADQTIVCYNLYRTAAFTEVFIRLLETFDASLIMHFVPLSYKTYLHLHVHLIQCFISLCKLDFYDTLL